MTTVVLSEQLKSLKYMQYDDILEKYRSLANRADESFLHMQSEYPDFIECRIHCSDCCHAVFGIFLIEVVSLQRRFRDLATEKQESVLCRAKEFDRQLAEIKQRLAVHRNDDEAKTIAISKERVPCPLLGQENECLVYESRPITCRIYGVPTAAKGKLHVCERSGFRDGETYPCFDLDRVNKALYLLSKELIARVAPENADLASYLFAVSKSVTKNQLNFEMNFSELF